MKYENRSLQLMHIFTYINDMHIYVYEIYDVYIYDPRSMPDMIARDHIYAYMIIYVLYVSMRHLWNNV